MKRDKNQGGKGDTHINFYYFAREQGRGRAKGTPLDVLIGKKPHRGKGSREEQWLQGMTWRAQILLYWMRNISPESKCGGKRETQDSE